MAACGLDPGKHDDIEDDNQRKTDVEHVAVTMIKFAFDMIKQLNILNREAGQTWKLRIGECCFI